VNIKTLYLLSFVSISILNASEKSLCGQEGSIEERILNCNETKVNGAIVITRHMIPNNNYSYFGHASQPNMVPSEYIMDSFSKLIWGPEARKFELKKIQKENNYTYIDEYGFTHKNMHQAAIKFCQNQNEKLNPPLGLRTWRLPIEKTYMKPNRSRKEHELYFAFNPFNDKSETRHPINLNFHKTIINGKLKTFWSGSTFSKSNDRAIVFHSDFRTHTSVIEKLHTSANAICAAEYSE